jgi:hypothetical protein
MSLLVLELMLTFKIENDGECSGAVFKTNPSSSSSSFSFALLLIPSKVFSLSLGYSKHTGTQEKKEGRRNLLLG